MKEYAFTCQLRDDPEVIRLYEEYHANAWPEVLESLRATGVVGARIYRIGHRLFMIVQTADDYDPATAGEKHWNASPRIRQWEELMASFQERVPEAPPGEGKWAALACVFEM